MPRRAKFLKRVVGPDPKYGSPVVSRFINKIMLSGKKATAQVIVYDAFERINKQMKTEPLPVFEQAMKNATPMLQVKSRRVGGATYQVPVEVSQSGASSWPCAGSSTLPGSAAAGRWLKNFSRINGLRPGPG